MGGRTLRNDQISLIIILLFVGNIFSSPIQPQDTTSTYNEIKNTPISQPHIEDVNEFLSNKPMAFTENCGQLDNDKVRFYDLNGAVWFTDDGVWFELREYTETRDQILGIGDSGLMTDDDRLATQEYKRVILKQEFVDANEVIPVGKERLGWNSNFFYGNDSSKWCTDVPNYAEVYYENIYNGIDLKYYTNEKGLKYDFIVHPGADPNKIRLRYNGAIGLKIDNHRDLIISTAIQDIIDGDLFIYQDYSNDPYPIDGMFKKYNDLEYGFEIQQIYNRQEVLVIDPSFRLEYTKYIGGSDMEWHHDLSMDQTGNFYLSGTTFSLDFPNTTGAYDETHNGGKDIFVMKLDYNYNINYSTFIGGGSDDDTPSITVASNGTVLISGGTFSADFPTTQGAFDSIFNGISDVFVVKLNSFGSKLLFSTLIGGSGYEWGQITIDFEGNPYVAGATNSSDFPTTSGAYDTSYNDDYDVDVFILKLCQNGSMLNYSTYIGGFDNDSTSNIVIDSKGNAYITGVTESLNFPTTAGVIDTSFNGIRDIFVLKLDQNGTSLIYSTFLGGINGDWGFGIALDSINNVFISGQTNSSDFPTTPGAFDETYNNAHDDDYDGFVSKLNNNGSRLIFSTYIGDTDFDRTRIIDLDLNGNLYVVGDTYSPNFPVTNNSLDSTLDLGDIFFLILSADGSSLNYSTYIGGAAHEFSNSIKVNSLGKVFLNGVTSSSDLPNSTGQYNGGWDVFIIQLSVLKKVNIRSLSLTLNNTPVNKIYSRLDEYSFRVNIFDHISSSELENVQLILDPDGSNIRLIWDITTGKFLKINDPNNYITIKQSSNASFKPIFKTIRNWTINFNVTFNWTYPDEDFHDVNVFASDTLLLSSWFNASKFYNVENDLIFNGTLSVKGKNSRILNEFDLINGTEKLTWSGLTPVYEGTTDIYPPGNELGVTVWSEDNRYWSCWLSTGDEFFIQTILNTSTNQDGYKFIINLTGIPTDCDHTNVTFKVLIDSDNVTFSNPWPDEYYWQKSSEVYTKITVTDHGGAKVDNESIMHCISEDNGTTWSNWKTTEFNGESETITIHDFVSLKDGDDNLIKWQAKDSVGNGPVESEAYRIHVDTQNVTFTNQFPTENEVSITHNVEVGITISDETSGVNASKIQYSISYNDGENWASWRSIDGYSNGKYVDVKLNLTFPNGTRNRIRWRAYDVAGNGPTISDEYVINVNLSKQPIIPAVLLQSPENGTKITKGLVSLSWELLNKSLTGVKYDVYLDNAYPPVKLAQDNYNETSLKLNDLENGQIYYWTVIPQVGFINGTCVSGTWSFKVEIPIPKVTLLSPTNGSTINTMSPTLTWNVDYTGEELLSYEVYLATDKDFTNSTQVTVDENFAPIFLMDYKETYYWKVIPWTGDMKGITSEVWSFTYEPIITYKFDLNLYLTPAKIKLYPGNFITVKAIVRNLGDITDNISINVTIPNDENVVYRIMNSSTAQLAPMVSHEFDIFIQIPKDAIPGTIIVNIDAISGNSIELSPIVMKNATLVIMVSKLDQVKDADSTTENIWMTYLFLIIIIILVICVVIIIMKRKKKEDDKEQPPEETEAVTIKPSAEPAAIITIEQEGQLLETKVQEQLPETTMKVETQVQEIESPEEIPQLPPGEVKEKSDINELAQSEGGQFYDKK